LWGLTPPCLIRNGQPIKDQFGIRR
jgi:hypothetical protein